MNKYKLSPNRETKFITIKRLVLFCLFLPFTGCHCPTEKKSPVLNQSDLKNLKEPPASQKGYSFRKNSASLNKDVSPSIPPAMKKLASLSLSEGVPLKGALIELARNNDIDLQLDPKITGNLVFSMKNRLFIEIIHHLCELAGLRYKVLGTSLKIEIDDPYPENYAVQFLNLARTSENKISIATDVFSTMRDQKNAADNGSNSSVTTIAQSDFWTELEGNLKIILSGGTSTEAAPHFSIHKQGGLISVIGTSKQHHRVSEYLKKLRQAVSTQVLIEAKIIEVSLNDQYRSGINWQKITGGDLNFEAPFGTMAQRPGFMDPTAAQGDLISLGLKGRNFMSLLKAIEEFGSSRTLSSPRLTVMNNQTAILKVAQNQVYFRLNYDKQMNLHNQRENISVSSDIQTVPIGLVMSVQPSIDHSTGEVILSLRPTISRLSKSVNDPAVDIAFSANNSSDFPIEHKPSLIPVVEVREIDSVLRLKSGEIAVLGGLMEVRAANETNKLPAAGDIPLLGALFRSTATTEDIVELVIFLKATIMDSGPAADDADKRLYEDYIEDPRAENLES